MMIVLTVSYLFFIETRQMNKISFNLKHILFGQDFLYKLLNDNKVLQNQPMSFFIIIKSHCIKVSYTRSRSILSYEIYFF